MGCEIIDKIQHFAEKSFHAHHESNTQENLRFDYVSKFIPSKGKILDVGCRDGYFRTFLSKDIEYYGIDFVERAEEYVENFVCIDATREKMPFSSNYFDVVHLGEILEHISNFLFLMEEVNRVLKPSGVVIITVPNVKKLSSSLAILFSSRYRYKYSKIPSGKDRHIHAFDESTLQHLLDIVNINIIFADRICNSFVGNKLPEWRIFKLFARWTVVIGKKRSI